MKKLFFELALIFLLTAVALAGFAQNKLLIGGSHWDKVAIIDKNTAEIEWSYTLDEGTECNDLEQTKAGNILIPYKKGAKLISFDKEVIWDFKVEAGQELFTATELPNGNFLLAVCANPSRFITLSKKGEIIKEQNFDLEIAKAHAQFRQVSPTKKGGFIIPVLKNKEVIEISKKNKVLRRIKVDGNPFSVKILPDGNWLVACGDGHKLSIINPKQKKVVQTITNDDVKTVELLFVGEAHKLTNGNILFANWKGHSKNKSQPAVIEIDSNNKVVWTLPENDKIGNVSAVHPIYE